MAYVSEATFDSWLSEHGGQPQHPAPTFHHSYWKAKAREVISVVMQQTVGQPFKERVKAIDLAYPFGARAYWPYTCWLEARKMAIAAMDK